MACPLLLITKSSGMRINKLLGIAALILLMSGSAYAGLIYGKETLPIVTKPEGAQCSFKNNKGEWSLTTPSVIKFRLSKKSLKVICIKEGYKTNERFIFARSKESLFLDMADTEIIGPSADDIIFDGILGAITSDPIHAFSSIVSVAIDGTAKITGKVVTFIKEPVTYATHIIPTKKIYAHAKDYEIKNKLREEGFVRFILIELEKE